MGSGDLLQLSSNALQAYQRQVSVFGQNIANLETKGYSRRSLELEVAVDGRGAGIGVHTGDVVRSFNALSASSLLREDSVLSFHSETAGLLEELEILTGGSNGGFSPALQAFSDAWESVSANPEDLAVRTELLQKASSLATEFNQLSERYTEFSETLVNTTNPGAGQIANSVADINDITTRMEDLNREIHNADFANRGVPALRDERDRLVRDLAQIANVSVSPDYRVTLGGQELISADGSTRQDVTQPTSDTFSVGGVDITTLVGGGKLAAQTATYSTVQGLQGQLDNLAQNLMTNVNNVFESGYNLNGENPVDAGYTFFTGSDASNVALHVALFDPSNPLSVKPELVAAAATRISAGPPAIPASGDNQIARQISALFDDPQGMLGNRSPVEYWSDVETSLAGSISEARSMEDTSSLLVNLLDQRMQSQSGINLDEELANMMTAQRAYEACSRVFSTANKLLDTLMNI